MTTLKLLLATLVCGILMMQTAADGWAQAYPTKPVRYMVPSSPGSSVDTIGRIVADGLTEALGQQVIVENRAGAGGNIGAALAAKAAPDGYTVVQVNNNHTTNVTLYKKRGYDLMRDFAPVTKLAVSPYVLVVHPSLPVKSVQDLIKLAKAKPGAITYASAGVGSGTFMVTELFKSQAKLDMLHIPYVGGGPALTAVMSGEALLYGAPMATALPQIKAGRLRALGVSTETSMPLLPKVPPITATVPDFEFSAWAGLLVPANTPKEIIATLRAASLKALKSPKIDKRLSDLGFSVAVSQPEELVTFMRSEIAKMAKLIRDNNIATR